MVVQGIEAQKKVVSGVNQVVDLAKRTLGSEGRLVVIDNPLFQKTTKDGFSIIKAVNLDDSVENMGNMFIREASMKTNTEVADNTTTTAVIAQSLINNGFKLVEKGISPILLKEGIKRAENDVILALENLSTPVDKSEIYEIAKTSANGDEIVAKLIQDAYNAISIDGVVEIEETVLKESSLEIIEGFRINKGSISHHLFTDVQKEISEIYNVNVLIYDGVIEKQVDLEGAIKVLMAEENTSLLIVADEIDNDVANWLIEAKKKKQIHVSIVKNPSYDIKRGKLLEDLAAFTGGEIYNPKLNTELKLGKADKVTTSFETTLIQRKDRAETLSPHLEILKFQEQTERIANLSSNVAVIYVGGVSTSEISELKDRFDDAIGAVKTALAEGIVVGAGTAFKHISKTLKPKDLGYNILLKSICAPFYQILDNASVEYLDILGDEKKEFKNLKYGTIYNTSTKKIEKNSKITDTAKGLRCALKNAVSVSIMVLSIDGAIC